MKRKRTRWIVLWSVVTLALLASIAVVVPVPPHGRFATPQIACLADSYYEFSGDQYWHVMFTGERDREGDEQRQFIGHYWKEEGRWIIDAGDGRPGQVRATLFSVQFIEPDGRRSRPFYRYWHF